VLENAAVAMRVIANFIENSLIAPVAA